MPAQKTGNSLTLLGALCIAASAARAAPPVCELPRPPAAESTAGERQATTAERFASDVPAADAILPTGLVHAGDACTIVDVMVVYTPSSRALLGGAAATQAVIDGYIVYANAAYRRSGVAHRFRLVHQQEVDYAESGNSLTDLDRLRDPADGFMDNVHGLRDTWGADLVSLINTSGSAGVGYLMDVFSVAFADSAFSAIGADTGPLNPGLVFAHETGHNMGCAHNNGGAQVGLFCYSYGHRTPDDQWRTIMSSQPGTFVDYFSTPNVEFAGWPLGVAGDGCPPDAADCARSLNETAPVVAQFRETVVPMSCAADYDCDGQVDLADFAALLNCYSGPAVTATACCESLDLDADGDVDWTDWGAFQRAFGAQKD